MAGNEIYIGKMLERLYGVVDKIDASTQAQIDALHDTTAVSYTHLTLPTKLEV